ncbi:peptide ABC transporter substrate-binding protein [Brachyspira hyodysenteriae]|uniref:peptide ABC transporter substrate-binding protein n=1 Tax=Brachyspira hyodysenteriae TaxID=159 RepID=UPI00063DBE9E|nr:peptide ABC transporter substrate-binding protein [Brachyspira hyodysenteriae]KLI20198.1 peptide ABC transporter substrate-binding protein [Brachyspira hyodysenteriae]KLI35485.1 peptide ABC transporter substrate-binding protein [Brachyspira hyodysenteriae]MBT8720157.1 peptide ABC transporter substrate-binding protein [Brachyspira hyodysenteriae]MBT8730395.1 peptide ABC transporter substrate-binding protein [Brachyspira hyodysenteriae]MBT8732756.1 peptide ABC transporter substrate-binding pr
MKKILIMILSVIMMLLFISCGGKKNEEGAIYINVGPEPKTIDPALNSTVDANIYIQHVFEGLATRDKDNKIVPGVAERWDISEDGLTYTFHIRDNAKWSDGEKITAEDFVYAWQRVVDPVTASEYAYQFEPVLNAMDINSGKKPVSELGIKAIDEKTLEVKLNTPTAYFLELVAFYTFYPVRKDMIEENGDNWTLSPDTYIGNGPFIMTERRTDDRIVVVKNTNYWNVNNIVPEKLVFILMQNGTAAVAGIKEGSLHFANNPPLQDIENLKSEGLMHISPYLGTYYYCLNITNEILKDARVRKALTLAIDRNYLVEQVTRAGQLPASAWVPSGVNDVEGADGDFRKVGGDYYSIKPEDHQKNLEEAKQLLADAGYPNGENFPVIEFKSNSGEHIQIFEAVQQMWKEGLGIDSTIAQEEWATFQTTRQEKNYVIARHGWIADYNDPMSFLGVFLSYSIQNNGGYSNKAYDDKLKLAMSTIDQDIRMKAMHEAEDILMEDMGLIPLYFYTDPIMISKKLSDVIFDPLGAHKFYYAKLAE